MIAVLSLLALLPAPAPAAPLAASDPVGQGFIGVDLRAANTPVRQALANIARQVPNVRFDVARDVQGNVSTWFINLPYDKALDRVAGQVGAEMAALQETKPDPKRPNANLASIQKVNAIPALAQKVTVEFAGDDIRDCLRRLFRIVDKSYTIEVALRGATTAKCDQDPFNTALAKTLAPVRGYFRVEGGIYVILSTTNAIDESLLQRRPISFSAEKERRLQALSRFARQAGITIELEGNVNVGDRVTLKSEGQSISEVLRAILGKQSTFAISDGALVVRPVQPG